MDELYKEFKAIVSERNKFNHLSIDQLKQLAISQQIELAQVRSDVGKLRDLLAIAHNTNADLRYKLFLKDMLCPSRPLTWREKASLWCYCEARKLRDKLIAFFVERGQR